MVATPTSTYRCCSIEAWAVPFPEGCRGFMSYELPDDYEQLYRRLTRQPAVVRAPLGKLRRLEPLEVLSGTLPPGAPRSAGFEEQAALTRHITPEQYPVERLAPAEGLFLSRLIQPSVTLG